MIEVCWYPDVPAEIKAVAEPLIHRYLHLLPPWVKWLRVYYQDSGSAFINVQYRYRELKLTVAAGLLLGDEEFRRNTFLHEFAHAYTAPISDTATTSMRIALGEDHNALKIAEEAMDAVMESMTEDLATLFAKFN